VVGPLRIAAEVVVLVAVGVVEGFSVVSEATRGDLGLVVLFPFEFALRKGEAVRLTTGGVAVLEGGLLGRLIDGLSHDEKKSSAGSPAGVEVPSPGAGVEISVMTTSSGYSIASAFALLFNSSLYFAAAFEVYLTFASLLARAAVPP
jgi:hypothetical protein